MRKRNHMWTKEELKQVLALWEKISLGEIAEELGVTRQAVSATAVEFRKLGYKLPKKRREGHKLNLMKEVIKESKNK